MAPRAPIPPPARSLLLLEGRALLELAALLPAYPVLRRAPAGDGHAVLVLPGLMASDFSTRALRRFLRDKGYQAHGWKQGRNVGPSEALIAAMIERLVDVQRRSGRKVSLIGWSLGGIYARELAKELPDHVRGVITLGTPFTGHPRATNAWRFFELVSGQSVHDPKMIAQIRQEPPVPTTSIWSRTDGIVSWRCSVVAPGPLAENIEVHASHVGMGMNPMALYAIADRLAQPAGHWKPFEPHGARRWFFRTAHAEQHTA